MKTIIRLLKMNKIPILTMIGIGIIVILLFYVSMIAIIVRVIGIGAILFPFVCLIIMLVEDK